MSEPAGDEPGYVLREEKGAVGRGPLRHERSLPLPHRVKSGAILPEILRLETANEVLDLPWSDIVLVALGIITEKHETEATAYNIEKMMGGVSRMMKGGGGKDESRIVSVRETNLLDIWVHGRPDPFRLDSASVNYRSFLGEISYVSFQNFFRLVHQIAHHATQARFTPPVVHFLARQRDRVHKFPAVHEFETDSLNRVQRLADQATWDQLSFQRTSWADEWADE